MDPILPPTTTTTTTATKKTKKHRIKRQCKFCSKEFSSIFNLNRHVRKQHHNDKIGQQPQVEVSTAVAVVTDPKQSDHRNECYLCFKKLSSMYNLNRHLKRVHEAKEEKQRSDTTKKSCAVCKKTFSSVYVMARHFKTKHKRLSLVYPCHLCKKTFKSVSRLNGHVVKKHNLDQSTAGQFFKHKQHALHKTCSVYAHHFNEKDPTPPPMTLASMYDQSFSHLVQLLQYELQGKKVIKFAIVVLAKMIKNQEGKEVDNMEGVFRSKFAWLRQSQISQLHVTIGHMFKNIEDHLLDLENHEGSDWTFGHFVSLQVEIGACQDYSGSNELDCSSYVNLLKSSILKSHLLLDQPKLPDKNQHCFFIAVIQGLMKSKRKEEMLPDDFYDYYEQFNLKGIRIPMELKPIQKFERQNSHLKLAINVFLYERKMSYPVYASSFYNKKNFHNINVLLLCIDDDDDDDDDDDEREIHRHYVCIENVNKFFSHKKDKNTTIVKNFICPRCLSTFRKQKSLNNHLNYCSLHKVQKVQLPDACESLSFTSTHKTELIPFTGFLDFEASMHAYDKNRCISCHQRNIEHCTHDSRGFFEQKPMMYHLLFIDKMQNIVYHSSESGSAEKVMEHFYTSLFEAENHLKWLRQQIEPLCMTLEDQAHFDAATRCWMCKKIFWHGNSEKEQRFNKVRDHDHYTGRYVGAAHQQCNIDRRHNRNGIPVYCHNLSNYDMQFLVNFMPDYAISKLNALPFNSEKLRCLNISSFKFTDSLHFLNGSLATLVDNLKTSANHKWSILKNANIYQNEEQKQLLLRKGIFPYEWVNSAEQLEQFTRLPSKDDFYSQLTQSHVSSEDYLHAQRVWDAFSCRNMLDYCNLYCLLDVLLLAECFTEFRKIIYADYGLDAASYISLPQLSFDAMLKSTSSSIGLISDVDQHLLVEKGIRGGVSFVNSRLTRGEANPEKNGTHLLYLDVNNLYGKAQAFYMP